MSNASFHMVVFLLQSIVVVKFPHKIPTLDDIYRKVSKFANDCNLNNIPETREPQENSTLVLCLFVRETVWEGLPK